jgi:hypothetical protein
MRLHSISKRGAFGGLIAAAALMPLLFFGSHEARAADVAAMTLLSPGDAVVTGFSGVVPPVAPPPSGDPIDGTFIDPDGASMRIQRLQPSGPPTGQVIASPTIFSAKAREVGQVFAITLDDAPAPNIYLGATSAFGIQIVAPDADGDGIPERIKTGQPGAMFMDGQWGQGGAPGSIYKVDGATGAVSLFTTVGANAGPGLGDVVFDRTSHQFFVSDLDTGLIYRLDATGLITDTFDHGVDGRPQHGLPAVADDGSTMDITNPSFNAEDPSTWGYTQKERMVYGMAVHGARLYYAVDGPQIWSIGINLDGSFAHDARWELDVTGLASADPVTDIAFDAQGRIILAQRGAQHGSYDYTIFAEPKTSSVVRYRREVPDDPSTPGTWVEVPEQYAIGFRPDGHNANGGVALGPAYDENGYIRPGTCGETLWSTGESLRENDALAAQLAAGGPATIHGLQGNDEDLVRPANDPPFMSYFADYDDQYDDPANQGHLGDVEIYQSCAGVQGYGPYIPPYYPPPEWTPPPGGSFDLAIDKVADPRVCYPGGQGWICGYTIRVTNVGAAPYWGPISVADWIPGQPPGSIVTFAPQPPWACGATGPNSYQCEYPPVFLYPGEGVDLHLWVDMPKTDLCYLENEAHLTWPFGYGDANPANDFAYATAEIPNEKCHPTGNRTNLKLEKRPVTDICATNGTAWGCLFVVTVTNTGPGVYNGPIQVTDQMSVPNPIVYGPQPNPPAWTCSPGSGGNYTCDHAPVVLNPGQSVKLLIATVVPVAEQEKNGKCTVENRARITLAPGGSPQNSNPGDDAASAEAKTPGKNCEPIGGRTDLSIKKEGLGCVRYTASDQAGFICGYKVTVTNEGPSNFTGPLVVRDTYTGAPAAPIFTPSWACAPVGGGAYDCTSPGPFPIAPGGSRFFATAVFVPANGDVCRIGNSASIKTPPGGSPQNTNPANDNAGPVIQVLPIHRCGPPPPQRTNVKIEKVERGCAPVTGAAAGQITCAFVIKVTNTGPGAVSTPIGFLDVAQYGTAAISASAPGWICGQNNSLSACVMNPGSMAPGASATFNLRVAAPLELIRQNGCRLPNTATLKLPPVGPENVNPADDVASATATLPANLCNPVAPVACPTPQKMPNGGCCPDGSFWNGRVCAPVETPKCPSGMIGTPPNCHPPVVQVCPPGSVGVFPNCRCPAGTIGQPPNCKPIVVKCPSDSVGPGVPNCRCKPGTIGTPGRCKPIVIKLCPPGSTGVYPDCKCPAGMIGRPPNCKKPPIVKPPVIKLCPPGSTGTYPNCKCPAGTIGRPPNCKPVVIKQPPVLVKPPVLKLQCPKGSVGQPPDCKCPPGTTGTPGNCQTEIR